MAIQELGNGLSLAFAWHDDVTKWKHTISAIPFVGRLPFQRASNVELWCLFRPMLVRTNCRTCRRVAGDLWCHDVRVTSLKWKFCDATEKLNECVVILIQEHLQSPLKLQQWCPLFHYSDVTISAYRLFAQLLAQTHRKQQISASLAFVRGIYRWQMDSFSALPALCGGNPSVHLLLITQPMV